MKNEPQEQKPPPSEYDTLNGELAENPHNPQAWRRLVTIAEESGDIGKIKATYDTLLKQYPNTTTAQIQYISYYLSDESTFSEAERLFEDYLKTSPFVKLWSFYLTYVRRVNSDRDIVKKSYEFALNRVGHDKDSGSIWSDYIQFLRSGETTTTGEEQKKMDELRKVYHRAVQIPLDNVERLWQDLQAFETRLNDTNVKKFLSDLSPAHIQAGTVLRQLTKHLGPLYASHPQGLYLPSLPKFDASELILVGKWKAYLRWEETNPLEIEDSEKEARLRGVYRKAVVQMRYHTEIWFMAYTWANSVGKHDEAVSIIKAGIEANPSGFLLTFTYAEYLETKKDNDKVNKVYNNFLKVLEKNIDLLEQNQGNASNGSAPENDSQNESSSSQGEKPPTLTELQKHRTEYGLAWIMYMRFGRRAEGVKSSRTIFGRARKERWTPWEVYEAAALMEYHGSDDGKKVASRIFEKGMDVYPDEIEFVLRYLGFLISINDENNARALFEQVSTTFPPETARPLWERWARYEYQYGELEASLKLEKRMAEVYPSDSPIKRLAQRHTYLGTDAIADRDLGFALNRRVTVSSSLGCTETTQSSQHTQAAPSQAPKHLVSPDHQRRDDGRAGEYARGHKRARFLSPPPPPARGAERDGDGRRWDTPPSRSRRFNSPAPPPSNWDREDRRGGGRAREAPPSKDRDDDRDKSGRQTALPQGLSWFIKELPAPACFDGPVFRPDDLINLFRDAVPSSIPRAKLPVPPPLPRSGGRPPLDYGSYQGPNSGRGRRY